MSYRPLPAGPELAHEGPQLQGRQTIRYAVHTGGADPHELVDTFTPLPLVRALGGGERAHRGTFLSVRGAEVTAVHRDGHALIVRVYNPRSDPTTLRIADRHGHVVDLRGTPIGPFHGSLVLGPWQIATLSLVATT
jgi:hypothetical protein